MPNERFFTDCKCPVCGQPLAAVRSDTTACPFCRQPLVARQVWRTRPIWGLIRVPLYLQKRWRALCLMIAGVGLSAISYYGFHGQQMLIFNGLFAVGLGLYMNESFNPDDT
jgi:hypothetical protein